MDILISRRAKQLEEQIQLDSNMKKLSNVCPQQVSNYFLTRRIINRRQYEMIREGGLMNAYSNIHKNIDEIDTDQKTVLSLFKHDKAFIELKTVCVSLNEYNTLLSDRLGEK